MSAKAKAAGHTVKHVKASKAGKKTAKHHPSKSKTAATHKAAGAKVTTKGTHAHHAKAAGFAVGDLLPVCSAEAVAMSLRLAGQRVADDDVLELHYLAGGSADVLVSVEAALAAAVRFGLAGYRPRLVADGAVDEFAVKLAPGDLGDNLAVVPVGYRVGPYLARVDAAQLQLLANFADGMGDVHGLILHVDVPGPHAVLATADGWWSWGELFSPWRARVSEAWAVSWS